MRPMLLGVLTLVTLTGCGPTDRQNSMFCGLTQMEAGNRIMDQLARGAALLEAAPAALQSGSVPTRAFGHPPGHSLAATSDSGVVLGFVGEGMPGMPGFGVALVDDSSEVFRGVVIFDSEPPPDTYPTIGYMTNQTIRIPLYGTRIYWPSVSNEDCPLFGSPTDSSDTP